MNPIKRTNNLMLAGLILALLICVALLNAAEPNANSGFQTVTIIEVDGHAYLKLQHGSTIALEHAASCLHPNHGGD